LYDLLAGPLYGGTLIYACLLPEETENKSNALLLIISSVFCYRERETEREKDR
jgi:hypothetical protein